jgi:RNA polymerase sigma-54 factor
MSDRVSLQLNQKQSLKQAQRLIMLPQMQQALHMLQVPVMELSSLIELEMEQNPVIEYGEEREGNLSSELEGDLTGGVEPEEQPEEELKIDEKDFEVLRRLDEDFNDHFSESGNAPLKRTAEEEEQKTYQESSLKSPYNATERLLEQVEEFLEVEEERRIAWELIGNLDDRGVLTASLEEVAALGGFALEKVEKVLERIQQFDPPGVGARSMQEALLLQLKRKGKEDSLAFRIVSEHYDEMIHNKLPSIAKQLPVAVRDVQEAIQADIAHLDLHPLSTQETAVVQVLTPDLRLVQEGEKWRVEVVDEGVPSLRVNRRYLRMLEDESLPLETKEYIKQKILSCKWLLKNIHQRNETLYRIGESLIKWQKDFLEQDKGELVPLMMKTVAEEAGVHESTIARAVANKCLECPKGLIPLRSFFTNAYTNDEGEEVSSSAVKNILKRLIAEEDKKKPLSDEALSQKIKAEGIPCARRTVAKYRGVLRIGSASQRRVFSV